MTLVAIGLVVLAMPAATSADPRPTLPPMHNCGHTPMEGHGVRVTHISANRLVGTGTGHTNHGCDRAVHIVREQFLHKETCIGTHPSVCNLGQYGPHGIYYEFSCRHHYDPELHHWHSCYNQSTGAKMSIDWHGKHH